MLGFGAPLCGMPIGGLLDQTGLAWRRILAKRHPEATLNRDMPYDMWADEEEALLVLLDLLPLVP
jgi:hypothetical protein